MLDAMAAWCQRVRQGLGLACRGDGETWVLCTWSFSSPAVYAWTELGRVDRPRLTRYLASGLWLDDEMLDNAVV